MRGGDSVLAFLVLHVVGLGTMIVVCVALGMWDLAVINSLVFLMLVKLEMVLCRARYTAPMPVYADGTVGVAAYPSMVGEPSAVVEKPLPESAITPEFVVAA